MPRRKSTFRSCGHRFINSLTIILIFLSIAPIRGSEADHGRDNYAQAVSKSYNFKFGNDSPFLPSNAKIEGNEFLQASSFPTAAYCGHCHDAIYQQWRQSLHSNSFRAPFYKKNVDILADTKGIEDTRHCEGCHNPISLFSGALTQNSVVADRSFDEDGITCSVCHSIQQLQPTYGLGSYVMGIPAVIVDERGEPVPGIVPDSDILSHPERHSKAVMRDFYRSPQFCGSCHKANIPRALNNYKWLRAIGVYDEWQNSSWSKQSPLPFYEKPYTTCQDCHMSPDGTQDKYLKNGEQVASHRWLGGNTAVPFYYGYDEQLKKTTEFLQAQRLNIDLFALRVAGSSELVAPLGSVDFTLQPESRVEAAVVVQNRGLGHSLIPEQRDIYEAWVEFLVKDSSGQEIFHSGYINGDGTLDREAHSFTNRNVDKNGNPILRHEIWLRRALAFDNTISPGRSSVVRYEFGIPKDARSPLTITARVNYRHFNEGYVNFVLGEKHSAYPIVEMASQTRSLNLGKNGASQPGTQDNPDWMRWNNWGIALLEAQRYADAVSAFERVIALRPGYADGFTNIGFANLLWEKYEPAETYLEKSLSLSPINPRASYYQALVDRRLGRLSSAEVKLSKLETQFPMSRDVHRELGITEYLEHKDSSARQQFESVQSIDPDDLMSHYYLSLLYRRIGMKQEAETQAALYEDKRDDQTAITSRLAFFRSNPDLADESVSWHLHRDTGKSSAISRGPGN